MSLEVAGLTKRYGTQKAVDNISFSVKKGEIVGFLGPNGAGKSTTMKIATGYLAATSGTVKVCGHDVQQNSRAVRKSLGYLPEHNPLYLDMYVREYLRFVGRIYHIKGKALTQRVEEMVETCGLTQEAHKPIGALSKGYRQRVGLAQALIHDPEVLILDEPTTGLDPNQIVEIRQVIKSVSQDKAIILSSHIMQEVQALCDRVVIINKGSIVADQGVDQLTETQDDHFVILIEFEQHPQTLSLKEDFPAITDIKSLDEKRFLLEASEDIRSQLFAWAQQEQQTIVGLSLQKGQLEDVFYHLTKA